MPAPTGTLRARIRLLAQRDRYVAGVREGFLDLPDTDENWEKMTAAVARAREAWMEDYADELAALGIRSAR